MNDQCNASENQFEISEQPDLNPNLKFKEFKEEWANYSDCSEPQPHYLLLAMLIDQIQPVKFRELAKLPDEKVPLKTEHYLVILVEELERVAKKNNWGMCKSLDFLYLYNGAFWQQIGEEQIKTFLGKAAEKMGIDKFKARYNVWCEQLHKQFLHAAKLPAPEKVQNVLLINLLNGTLEISPEKQKLRQFNANDFITYQLDFNFDPSAQCPIFDKYLEQVQPDENTRQVLAEYVGYVFVPTSYLKLEKVLLLYGSGANGKSVFFEVINALLGRENNVSNYSLQNLTNDNGYYRAMIANKLLNYASEINGKIETSHFKLMASGEPIEARLPYGRPLVIDNYAKLMFNCNELPTNVEQTHAFFRRLLIAPFNVTIPEEEQDKQLANKIIKHELSGVLNWAIAGLKQLIFQKSFTNSQSIENQLEEYRLSADTVRLFIKEEEFESDTEANIPLQEFYGKYKYYCRNNGFYPESNKRFAEKIRNLNILIARKNKGNVVFVKKNNVL